VSGQAACQSSHRESENGTRESAKRPAGGRSCDRSRLELTPEALGAVCVRAVVHQEVRLIQEAAHAELERLPRHAAVEHRDPFGQRVVRDDDRDPADGVVDDLVPDENAQRVRAWCAADDDADDLPSGRGIMAYRLEPRKPEA
jgi:hypothetical protein